MVKVAVIQYPGSNCDLDALEVLRKVTRLPTDLVWHKSLDGDDYDGYILPGGFSYGDYLRAGAIAATSPSLNIVKHAAEHGKPVLGIWKVRFSEYQSPTMKAGTILTRMSYLLLRRIGKSSSDT